MHTSHPGWKPGLVAAVVGCLLLGATGVAEAQRDRATREVVTLDLGEGSRIGIAIEDVADNDSVAEGAFVRSVNPNSPAESAGFSEGDIVVEFDGERVRGVRQMTRLVQETPGGRTVAVVVMRDGGRVELEVTPEPRALTLAGAAANAAELVVLRGNLRNGLATAIRPNAERAFRFSILGSTRARLGVNVQELTDQLADYFDVDDGVLVSRVDEDSVADDAGLQAGDVITAVDGRGVGDAGTLRRRLSGLEAGDEVVLQITRSGRALELTATMGDERSGLDRVEVTPAGPAI